MVVRVMAYALLVVVLLPMATMSAQGLNRKEQRIEFAKEFIEEQAPETNGGGSRRNDADLMVFVKEIAQYTESLATLQCNRSRFYHIEGKCNNLQNPLWGAAFVPFQRDLPNDYADGMLVPRIYARGTNKTVLLPSARQVTLTCLVPVDIEQGRDLHPSHSQNLMQFGQYFSHDLGLTPIRKGTDCCEGLDENGIHPDTFNGGPCFPIPIPEGDRHFTSCMVFNRSVYEIDHNGVAQQLSSATHVLDQSTVYGSTEKFARSIRTFQNGLLRTDQFGLLPEDNTQKCFLGPPLTGCPVAGDNRLSVFPGLTTTHLIFHLEHNRLAKTLHDLHPEWEDDRLFQEARAIMIAETQNLVYQEFLPLVLGPKVMNFFGLQKPARYDANLNPGIINAFQTAAFRFGHSQINNIFHLHPFLKDNLVTLNLTFFRPYLLFYEDKPVVKEIIFSLMTRAGQKVDASFARGVLDDLFLGVDAPGHSTDLPSRNIQRGRDHGLPPYLDYLDKAFSVFGDEWPFGGEIVLPGCLAGLYRSARDMDLWLGGIFERHVSGGQVGPVFAYLIGQQFKNLREGDRLFFDTQGSDVGFSEAQIKSIKKTRYSGIICRTTGLQRVPLNAFKVPHDKRNPMVDCDSIPDVDLSLW